MLWIYAVTACLASTAVAVFRDEAYQVDYHHALLGLPLQETTFFHQPYAGSKASLIYTFTEEGVVGAVNPSSGDIVWRQKPEESYAAPDLRRVLKAGKGEDTVLSAAGRDVSAWSSTDGRVVWQKDFDGRVADIDVLEMPLSDTQAGKDSIMVLQTAIGPVVHRLDAHDGGVKWIYSDERYG
jgi:outer membrane protein assembly factor BamB